MALFSVVALLFFGVIGCATGHRECHEDIDLVFMLDQRTTHPHGWPKVKRLVEATVDKLMNSGSIVQVGVVTYAEEEKVRFYLNHYKTKRDIKRAIRNIPALMFRQRYSRPDEALDEIEDEMFEAEHGGRRFVSQFVVMVTDGEDVNPRETREEARELIAKYPDLHIIPVGVGQGIQDAELHHLATHSTFLHYPNWDTAIDNVATLAMEICGSSLDFPSVPIDKPVVGENPDTPVEEHVKKQPPVKNSGGAAGKDRDDDDDDNDDDDDDDGDVPIGAIVGASVGGLALLAGAATAGYFYTKRREDTPETDGTSNEAPDGGDADPDREVAVDVKQSYWS